MKKTAFLVSFILVSSILLGCTNSKDKAVSKEDIWKKNPLSVVQVYFDNINNHKKEECVYNDVDIDSKENSKHFPFLATNPDKEKESYDIINKSIEKSYFISAKPSNYQEKLTENPIKVKSKDGKIKKFYNPITLDVTFKTNYKKDAPPLPFERDYDNITTVLLIQDDNGDYKILSMGH